MLLGNTLAANAFNNIAANSSRTPSRRFQEYVLGGLAEVAGGECRSLVGQGAGVGGRIVGAKSIPSEHTKSSGAHTLRVLA